MNPCFSLCRSGAMVLRTSHAEKRISQVKHALRAVKSVFCRPAASSLHQAHIKPVMLASTSGGQGPQSGIASAGPQQQRLYA